MARFPNSVISSRSSSRSEERSGETALCSLPCHLDRKRFARGSARRNTLFAPALSSRPGLRTAKSGVARSPYFLGPIMATHPPPPRRLPSQAPSGRPSGPTAHPAPQHIAASAESPTIPAPRPASPPSTTPPARPSSPRPDSPVGTAPTTTAAPPLTAPSTTRTA